MINKLKNFFRKKSLDDSNEKKLIKREAIVGCISEFFESKHNEDYKYLYSIYGEGGVGKSCICQQVIKKLSAESFICFPLIDFNIAENRSLIKILFYYCENFGESSFVKTQELLEKVESTDGIEKNILYKSIVENFKNELIDKYGQKKILFVFDTIEKIDKTELISELLSFLLSLNVGIRVLFSGRNKLGNVNKDKVAFDQDEIDDFSLEEVKAYFEKRFLKDKHLVVSNERFFHKIFNLTNGHPIFCALSADWIVERPNQIDYILELDKENFQREIVAWLKFIDEEEFWIINHLAYFPFGINKEIIIALNKNIIQPENKMKGLKRFSFIKSVDDTIYMHDEIVELVRKNFKLNEISVYQMLIKQYYDIQEKERYRSYIYYNKLNIEKIYFMMYLSREDTSSFVEQIFLQALGSYDYEYCRLVLLQIGTYLTECNNEVITVLKVLLEAELMSELYQPQDALQKLETLNKVVDAGTRARIKEIKASCIINPHTIQGRNLFEAIDLYKESIQEYIEKSQNDRLGRAWYGLAKSYVSVGESILAEEAFDNAIALCKNDREKIKILDEKSNMLRLQQKVSDSRLPLKQSYEIRNKIKTDRGVGIYYYYLGNTERDSDNFEDANKYYLLSEEILEREEDWFKLCEVYCDHSWMEFLRSEDNYDEVFKYLEKSKQLMFKYGFGAEYSEYYHILYEVNYYIGNKQNAFYWLDKALKEAFEYSNIYMILDCLNHDVHRRYEHGDIKIIKRLIEKMEEYEKKGCGIKVFRGRAMLIEGDISFDERDFYQALALWIEGFSIVALYGNSRSNVLLFEDLYRMRKVKIKKCINECRRRKIDFNVLKEKFWSDESIQKQFVYFIKELEANE